MHHKNNESVAQKQPTQDNYVSIYCPFSYEEIRRFKDSTVIATCAYRRNHFEDANFHAVLDDFEILYSILSQMERHAIAKETAKEQQKEKDTDRILQAVDAMIEDVEQIRGTTNGFTEEEQEKIRIALESDEKANSYDKARIHEYILDNNRFVSDHQKQRIQDALDKNKEVIAKAKNGLYESEEKGVFDSIIARRKKEALEDIAKRNQI